MVVAVLSEAVADFYVGKSILLTGGTGFLGKVFLEKLLYSCPDIIKIYMIVREKRGLTISQRINKIFDDPLFDRLKDKRPKDLLKVKPVSGDINKPHLGLCYEDEETLIETVSVVIHAAATVKFNEPLKSAWTTNVEGTKMILELAQRMKRVEVSINTVLLIPNEPLKSAWTTNVEGTKMILELAQRIKRVEVFVHISTAYTNTNREVIEEVLYPAPADIDKVYHLVKQDPTEEETEKILDGRPNTYTFTKALTEHLVAENQAHMPTIIIRPSIVSAIKEDPIKGWLQNWYGATGLLTSTAKGLNRGFFGRPSNIVDLIPVDYVANLVIISAAKNCRSRELKVYNSCSSGCNALPLGKLVKLFSEDAIRHKTYCAPFPQWYIFTRNKWWLSLITFLCQTMPAYFYDVCRRIAGKEPKYAQLQSRVIQTRIALAYFSDHSWVMKSIHTRALYSSLSPADKIMFPCDPATIDWDDYIRDYSWGIRYFLEGRK